MSFPRRQGGDSQEILEYIILVIEGIHEIDGSQCQGLKPKSILPLKHDRGSDSVVRLFLSSERYDKFGMLRNPETLNEAILFPDNVRRCSDMKVPEL